MTPGHRAGVRCRCPPVAFTGSPSRIRKRDTYCSAEDSGPGGSCGKSGPASRSASLFPWSVLTSVVPFHLLRLLCGRRKSRVTCLAATAPPCVSVPRIGCPTGERIGLGSLMLLAPIVGLARSAARIAPLVPQPVAHRQMAAARLVLTREIVVATKMPGDVGRTTAVVLPALAAIEIGVAREVRDGPRCTAPSIDKAPSYPSVGYSNPRLTGGATAQENCRRSGTVPSGSPAPESDAELPCPCTVSAGGPSAGQVGVGTSPGVPEPTEATLIDRRGRDYAVWERGPTILPGSVPGAPTPAPGSARGRFSILGDRIEDICTAVHTVPCAGPPFDFSRPSLAGVPYCREYRYRYVSTPGTVRRGWAPHFPMRSCPKKLRVDARDRELRPHDLDVREITIGLANGPPTLTPP